MQRRGGNSYLLLREIIGKVGNHDLGLGWDTVGRGTALTASFTSKALAFLSLSGSRQVGGVGQGKYLTSCSLGTFLTLNLNVISLCNRKARAIGLVRLTARPGRRSRPPRPRPRPRPRPDALRWLPSSPF